MENNVNEVPDVNKDLYSEITVEDIDEGQITTPFDPSLIDIDSRILTISNIIDLMKNQEIDLTPDFQRAGNLWDTGKQSRLIESIILRIPLPAFYFDVETKKNDDGISVSILHVIDGLQRLSAIRNFMLPEEAGENALNLSGLEFLKRIEGKRFQELPGPYTRLIEQTQLNVYLIKPGTPVNVKFNIFKRVNTGGVPLTQQEIRHALNQGIPAQFLKELAESDHFKTATRNKIDPKRMFDRELVNRFLAFYLLDRSNYLDLDSFLNKALAQLNKLTEEERHNIEENFYETLDTIFACFGQYAFCKLDAYPRMKPLNKVLFEVLTVSVAKLSPEERKVLLKNAKETPQIYLPRYVALFQENDGQFTNLVSVSTSDMNRINKRYNIMETFLKGILKNA